MNGFKPKRAPRSAARARWQQHLTAQQSSGQRQADYCRAHGLSPKYFSLWKRKLKLRVEPPAEAASSDDCAAMTFVPVMVKAAATGALPHSLPGGSEPTSAVLKAILANGVAVELALSSTEALVPLLSQLAQLPC
jgi:hypothetical protein